VLLSACECLWWQDAHYPDVLGRWLDYLQSSAPGAVVLPVLTQCDKLLPKAVSPLEVHHLERVVEEQASWVRRAIYWHQVIAADGG
jgi:hypothetical protein